METLYPSDDLFPSDDLYPGYEQPINLFSGSRTDTIESNPEIINLTSRVSKFRVSSNPKIEKARGRWNKL